MHRSHGGSHSRAEITLRTSAAFRSLRRPSCASTLAAQRCGSPISPEAVLRAEACGLLNVDEATDVYPRPHRGSQHRFSNQV